MRVDSHTQDWQAMRVLIHTHISCRLLVEGSAPKPLLNTEFHPVAARSPNASKGRSKSVPPYCFGPTVKQRGPWKLGWQNATPFFPSRDGCDGRNGAGSTPQNTVATVASVALYSITSNAGAPTTM